MTELNLNTPLSEIARWVNIFPIAASSYSPVFVYPEVIQMSNRCWINNQKRIRKQCLQRPWKRIPNGNIQCVQGFPASVFLIGMLELLLTLSVLAFLLNHSGLSFRLTACSSVHIGKAYYGLLKK